MLIFLKIVSLAFNILIPDIFTVISFNLHILISLPLEMNLCLGNKKSHRAMERFEDITRDVMIQIYITSKRKVSEVL